MNLFLITVVAFDLLKYWALILFLNNFFTKVVCSFSFPISVKKSTSLQKVTKWLAIAAAPPR